MTHSQEKQKSTGRIRSFISGVLLASLVFTYCNAWAKRSQETQEWSAVQQSIPLIEYQDLKTFFDNSPMEYRARLCTTI